MTKAEFIRARIEPKVKHEAETIFRKLGLSISEAVNLFYIQVILNRGLPFDVKIPNEETLKGFRNADERKDLSEWKSAGGSLTVMKKRAREKKTGKNE